LQGVAQGVLVGRYDGVDVVERSESVNDFLGCLDGIIRERTFVESCWSLVFLRATFMHAWAARPVFG
jgi:hypothetical protein